MELDRVEMAEWLKTKISDMSKEVQLLTLGVSSPFEAQYLRGIVDGYRHVLHAIQTNKFDNEEKE
jgi:hypothetical protein